MVQLQRLSDCSSRMSSYRSFALHPVQYTTLYPSIQPQYTTLYSSCIDSFACKFWPRILPLLYLYIFFEILMDNFHFRSVPALECSSFGVFQLWSAPALECSSLLHALFMFIPFFRATLARHHLHSEKNQEEQLTVSVECRSRCYSLGIA